jgi:hypothetical protein
MRTVSADQVRISTRIGSMALAAAFLAISMSAGYRYIGWTPVIIVGGSGAAAHGCRTRSPYDRGVSHSLWTSNESALQYQLERRLIPHDLRLHRAHTLHLDCAGALPPGSARGLSHVFHLHRSRCRGIHTLHLPGSSPRCTTYSRRVCSGCRGTWQANAGLAEFLGTCHRTLLLSGNIYRNPPDCPGHLRHS